MTGEARLSHLKKELAAVADPDRARNLAWYFKTGKGQYGEGDRFIGITVPTMRQIARRYRRLALSDVAKLLASRIHEHRFTALELLVAQYQTGDAACKQAIFDFYFENVPRINNWDLVDTSAPYIVGEHLLSRPRAILYELAKSTDVWQRRMSVVSTMPFIRAGDLEDTFAIVALLLADQHDLIHKACGWMLRETGKQSAASLLKFLKRHYSAMPRTTLRYAIERFPNAQRRRILTGDFSASSNAGSPRRSPRGG